MTDKVNTDWNWSRSKGNRYRPTQETPNLFISFANLFASVKIRRVFEDPPDARIAAWIDRYGRLYPNAGFDQRGQSVDQIVELAGVMAWCYRAINKFKELGCDHKKISVFEADRIRLELENPLLFVAPLKEWTPVLKNSFEYIRPQHSFPAARYAIEQGLIREDAMWLTDYSHALRAVRDTAQMYITNEIEVRFGEACKVPRDKYGRRVEDTDYADVYHSMKTVIEPKSLIGFMWIGLLQYLQDPNGFEFYQCEGFNHCGQYLNKKPTSPKRRIFCTDACRARRKRALRSA